MADILDFNVDGVKVRQTDFDKFVSDAALMKWRRTVVTTYETNTGDNGMWSERREKMLDELSQLILPVREALHDRYEAYKLTISPRNLDLVVTRHSFPEISYGMTGATAGEIVKLLDMFDRPEQMTVYEFDAYHSYGAEACDAENINTLYDLFGAEWAQAFYRRKDYLLVRDDLEKLYMEKHRLNRRIAALERQLSDLTD